jgi:hypothetical protein
MTDMNDDYEAEHAYHSGFYDAAQNRKPSRKWKHDPEYERGYLAQMGLRPRRNPDD